MSYELKKIRQVRHSRLEEFITGWGDEKIIPSSLEKFNGGFDNLKEYIHTMENDPPRLMAPSTLWFLTEGGKILGAVEVRHFLNGGLLRYGGHINFGVAPRYRGNNHAVKMLELAMPEMKKLGLEMALICCLEDNIPAAKVIEKAGGQQENAVSVIRNGESKTGLRYWLEIK